MTLRCLLTLSLAGLLAACGEAPKVVPPSLSLSGDALTFSAQAGAAVPAAQAITISNAGGGRLTAPTALVSYGSGAAWLAATVAGAAAPYSVEVQPTRTDLAAGTYSATVRVGSLSASNSPATIQVTLVVTAAPIVPVLALSAAAVEFRAATPGAATAAQVVTATSASAGALDRPTVAVTYPAGGPQGWLTVGVSAGAAPYDLTFQADSAGLPLGLATATVEVTSAGATDSPRVVAVRLWVGRVVEVRRLLTHWREDGTSAEVEDPSLTEVALLQDDGAGGTTRFVAQPGLAPGRWLALAAPGPYRAELVHASGPRLQVQADVELLDLGEDVGGRPAPTPATAVTTVTLALDGLIGWQQTDLLRLASWDAQASAELAPGDDPGATPYAFDWAATMGTLLAPGDTLWISHATLALPEGGGATGVFEYLEVQAAASLSQVTLASGVAQDLQATAQGPVAASLALDWRLEAMEGAAAPFDPATAGFAHRVGLYAIPAPLAAPSPLGGAAVTVIEATSLATSLAGVADIVEPTVSIGRFLPAAWREYQEVAFDVPVSRRAPGAATPLPGTANRVRAREALAAAGLLAQPLVGAPLAPTIDGLDALAAGNQVTLTPTIAWGPPAAPAATPTTYRVDLVELTAQAGATRGRPVAGLVVTGTSLVVPAGLLEAGKTYVASITARVRPTDAGGATPLRTGVPEGEASLWTEVFATAP